MAPASRTPTSPDLIKDLRYMIFGRVIPAVFFLLLGSHIYSQLTAAISEAQAHPTVSKVADSVQISLYFLFVSVPVVIYIIRPRARAQAPGILPRALAFLGTFGLLFFPLFRASGPPLPTPPAAVTVAAAVGLVFTTGFGLYGLLHLRRSFSIIPEARGLVQSGPYRFVRHPLYAGEIGSAVLVCFSSQPRLWNTVLVLPFALVQYLRTRFEEAVITTIHPEYPAYARRVGRFFPRPPRPPEAATEN